jgi:dolichyl-diphosphooligosaccharide--protein glycosyltransferase
MVKFGKLFDRERLVKAIKSLGVLRLRVSHSSLVVASLLLLILLLAFLIRILPMRWGTYLSEFDPYFQYRLAKRMVENGFLSWASWRDYMRWWPYGYPVQGSFPGLSFAAASTYTILNVLGLPITLLELCVVFPAIAGTLTCLVMYFLGKDFGGNMVGLFSAFFLALNASHIGRTSWGFFDDETVGIFGILLFMFLFLRSIETRRPLRDSMIYAIAGGLSLGYILVSWGAARYALGMTVVFVFALLLLRRYSLRLLFSYSTTFGVAFFITVNIPRMGFSFLTESSVVAALGIFLLLCTYEVFRYIKTTKMKTVFILVFLAILVVSVPVLSWFGYNWPLPTKYLYVLNPSTRPELAQSVQEQRPAAWGSFYYDLGIGAFLMPVGLFFAVRNPTDRNIFLIIFGLTSIYFAGSMIRLTLLLAPAVSLLWGLALVQLLRPFVTIMKEVSPISRRKTRFATHVGKEFSGALLIVMFLLLTFTFVLPSPRIFSQADTPTTIAAASVPLKPDDTVRDWIDTLAWMRETLPPTAVVASWWDYGYWITVWGNKTSIADNATKNTTQIETIGYMFMSNETEAIKVLEEFNQNARARGFNYNISHVLVFTTFLTDGRDANFGDEGKWRWMARIPGLDDNSFGNVSLGIDWVDKNGNNQREQDELVPNVKGQNSTLYKLMTYGKETKLGTPELQRSVTLTHFELAYFSKGEAIQGQVYALVCVYEVKYD